MSREKEDSAFGPWLIWKFFVPSVFKAVTLENKSSLFLYWEFLGISTAVAPWRSIHEVGVVRTDGGRPTAAWASRSCWRVDFNNSAVDVVPLGDVWMYGDIVDILIQ